MKSHLQLIPTSGMSREDWLNYRTKGIGASEVGTILGLDDYKSSIELYYEKIGEISRPDIESMAQFMGREQEDFIAELWTYWEGNEQTMIENWRTGNKVRKCQRVNAYVSNPKYPWLFVSLDRKINKHEGRDEGTLELKTISGFETDKWEFSIPPKYVVQVNTQMLVCEFEYGELALLEDGRHFDVLPLEPTDSICQTIISQTKEFWDRVVAGRKLVNEKYLPDNQFNQKRIDECNREIDKLAPSADGSMAFASFLREKFKNPTHSERRGTDAELEIAERHIYLKKELEEKEREVRLMENQLKTAMGNHQVLSFETHGKVYWTVTESGKRFFKNRVNV